METLHRYPGAQPFRDDEFSRRTFFGREPASVALTDQILANRLVVVYAKSGLGKTSLLNAGVAPRLREAGSLPLFVRVNDIQRGPLFSVLEGVRAEAERQQVEYVPGDSSSLWSFFKTVEFWRGDLLLTPVLILDQFEELFTLQSQEARERFLSELGYLVRGIPPASQPKTESNASEAPSSIRVVLSLREDFLGLLEEASDHIPEILDHRYRLAPLSYEMASQAITGPAAIEHRDISTKAFRLEPEVVSSILDYLTKSTAGAPGPAGRSVEPFHLQLICQRIEGIAAFKQQVSSGEIVVSFKDLGGEAALAETLESFYTDAIRSVPGRHLRGAVRILCEQYLISPEGRRLSVEERELLRQLKLPRETLSQLVERRLLRTDRRSDSTYYELSHDALVQPVLASRRLQALAVGWAALLAGSFISLAAGAVLLICLFAVFSRVTQTFADYLMASFFVILALIVGALGVAWFRSGLQRRRRYRRHTPGEIAEPLPTLVPLKDRLLGWAMLVTGPTLFIVWGFSGLFVLFKYGTAMATHGKVPNWLAWMGADISEAWPLMQDHPLLQMLWWVVEYSAIVLLGCLLLRQGARKLWPHKFTRRSKAPPVPGVGQAPSLVLASVKALFGGIALVVAALGFFTLRSCASAWHGSVPHWLTWTIISYRLSDACQAIFQNGWDWDGVSFAIFLVAVLVFSIAMLRNGVLEIRTALGHRRLGRPERGRRRAIVVAAACGILIAGSFLLWTHLRSRSGGRFFSFNSGNGTNEQTSATVSGPVFVPWRTLKPGSDIIYDVAFSPDGTTLASADNDSTVKLWSASTGQLLQSLEKHSKSVFGVAFSPDGSRLASASPDDSLIVWDVPSGDVLLSVPTQFGLWTVAYSKDGRLLAAAGDTTEVDLWNVSTPAFTATLHATGKNISRVDFSPDGRLLVAGGDDGVVHVWDAAQGTSFEDLKGHSGHISTSRFSPSGKYIVSGDTQGVILIWGVQSGAPAPLRKYTSDDASAINDVIFTPDGKYLISAHASNAIHIWNVRSGTLVRTLEGHTDTVNGLSITPDGRILASSSSDGTIRLWRLSSGQ